MLTRSLAGGPDAGDFRVVDEALPEPADGEFLVRHFGGWQEYALSTGERTERVDPALAPLSAWLGVLGMPGLTAWASAVELAAVQAGQTVLVSAALGPVGSLVGQLAIQRGATAVGIAGSDEKCAIVTGEFGFRACVNYRQAGFLERLRAALPEGVDVYHDNVGGQLLADAFSVLKVNGTVILCGLMERYNDPAKSKSLDLALPIMKRAVMKGLVVSDFEHRRPVFEAAGAHFARLMRGENVGKALVVLGPEAATWAVDTLYARGGRLPNLGQVAPVATGALDILIKFIYLGFSAAAALAVLLKGFGSVHVNGVHVETTGASFTVDDGRAQSTVLTW